MDRSTPAPPSARAVHIAWEFSVISTLLLATATLLFIARLWTRCFPVFRMLADDYVCAVGYVLVVINTSLFFKSVEWIFPSWKGDRTKFTIADMEQSAFWGIIAQPFWAWSMAMVKISIGLMLLRLESDKPWRRFLWAMIAFQVVLSAYNMLTQLLGCIPLSEMWDISDNVPGKCWPYHVESASQVTVQAFVILTDWIYALLPMNFLRKVQRPLRERAVIGLLMSLGVFAGVASIIKIKQILTLKHSRDAYADIIVIEMWCSIEVLTGFVVSCVPCLRGPFQRVLEHYGIVTLRQATTYAYGQYPGTQYATHVTSGKNSMLDPPLRMTRVNSSGGESVEHIITGSETAVKNGEIWCTTEVLMEEEETQKMPRVAQSKSPGLPWSGRSTPRQTSR
ncbi:hypothetical protein DPSP01_000945 [Paraphaeosphaeria sporulosa]|uniref:Rhodopsin domain-containing protein n=1 Tax=Paraphaeosphaeria sporulosa TaxID=1460663 RepID=A0A177C3X0_9PLEO|nr:uncharacterized protein CC84DRAFT_1262182 [Paraphaeosphaeria sporulosa]OAG02185.1 hypothetical protein CC84DRAFT_1262182 [Paraphaeosphaeria sporulosa]